MSLNEMKGAIVLLLCNLFFIFAYCQNEVSSKADKIELPLKYFIFRQDCYDIFFNKNDFTHSECIKITFSKLLGYAIIAGSSILKVPQIIKIVMNGSVEGISKWMMYIELLVFMQGTAYCIH
jgi:hypothetical protein